MVGDAGMADREVCPKTINFIRNGRGRVAPHRECLHGSISTRREWRSRWKTGDDSLALRREAASHVSKSAGRGRSSIPQ
jgi:hypothetical protein